MSYARENIGYLCWLAAQGRISVVATKEPLTQKQIKVLRNLGTKVWFKGRSTKFT